MPTVKSRVPNRLINETSPYLLQHANNPVDWYPWGDEAFQKAKTENKPVFLSIGYSTCHWCHVMAHESFEDAEVADFLNRHFISIKVDKEERPDIDSIYMTVCTALTGSGGWPMTIFMDPTAKPFFAGTYFPKHSRYRMPGLLDLLDHIDEKWQSNQQELLDSAEKIAAHINDQIDSPANQSDPDELIRQGIDFFKSTFDQRYGGFTPAPKFPSPHNLLFLMEASQNLHDEICLGMAKKTLLSMYKGGIFDHIGFGFSRYSTDEKWLAPHFEKMLYDNALLLVAYTRAYVITQNPLYKTVAEKTILFIAREMTHPDGGFYSAQDADSDGVEGKYYLFTPDEIISVLGKSDGDAFCKLYDITKNGNFEGENIPNQINLATPDESLLKLLPKLYDYRKTRVPLHKDDKILASWNALTIAALADASIVFTNDSYLTMAERAAHFIETNLCENGSVFTSFRDGKRTNSGVLDDYAFYIHALLRLHYASTNPRYLERAKELTQKVITDFFDDTNGGFFLTSCDSEPLLTRPKETYDGAIPSGNSVMTLNLITLNLLNNEYEETLNKQLAFMTSQASSTPAGYSFLLFSLLKKDFPDRKITALLVDSSDRPKVEAQLRGKAWLTILDHETSQYKLKDGKTTYYLCEHNTCHPPQNDPPLV